MSSRSNSTRVYVGNLSRGLRERDLEDIFYRYYGKRPTVKDGFGFIEFDDYRDAQDAVKDLDGYMLGKNKSLKATTDDSRQSDHFHTHPNTLFTFQY